MKREQSQSTHRAWSVTNPPKGFALVEIMLAIAVFLLLISTLTGAYLYGQEATVLAGNRARATMLAEEGLEAVRNIRDARFGNLTDGTYGLTLSGNTWILSGSSDTTDIFTRSLAVSSVDDERKNIVATIHWQQNIQRTGEVVLSTLLTNWQNTSGIPTCTNQADWLRINLSDVELGGNNKELRGVTLKNTHATCDIIIDRMTLFWTNTKYIEEIKIEGARVWKYNDEGSPDGTQLSGTELDIVDYTLAGNSTDNLDKAKFSGNMTGASFTLTVRMGDGTVTSTPQFSP